MAEYASNCPSVAPPTPDTRLTRIWRLVLELRVGMFFGSGRCCRFRPPHRVSGDGSDVQALPVLTTATGSPQCDPVPVSMSAGINSVQTHNMLHHFPIRCGQPDIQFSVIFRGQDEKHELELRARHQIQALTETDNHVQDVNLLWPERDILNWTSYISQYKVEERRFRPPRRSPSESTWSTSDERTHDHPRKERL